MIRRQDREIPIPTSIYLFKLNPPLDTMQMANVKNIRSVRCVTYIPRSEDRIDPTRSGFYVNVFPEIPWKRGMPLPEKDVWDGLNSVALTEKQKKLNAQHKEIVNKDYTTFKKLQKEHNNRCKLLKDLHLNVKKAHKIKF